MSWGAHLSCIHSGGGVGLRGEGFRLGVHRRERPHVLILGFPRGGFQNPVIVVIGVSVSLVILGAFLEH